MKIWKSWRELKAVIKNRKVVFFGRGEWVEKTLPYAQFNSLYIVDNNPNEQGTREHGLDVLDPETLKTLLGKKDQYYIIITTTDFYNVTEQLEGYGFRKGLDFCVTPALINHRILAEIESYSQKIILSSSDPYADSDRKGGGIYIYDTGLNEWEKRISGITQGFGKIGDYYYIIDDREGVRVFDKNLTTQQDVFELPKKSRPHGMAVQPETNLIYIAFSAQDAVGVYDAKTLRMVNKIPISEKYARTGVACHHVNDVAVFEDSLYISMFSRSGNWKKGCFDGAIMEYDLKLGKMVGPVVTGFWMPHSVKVIDGYLCYLDSMKGNFHITTWKVASHFNGFIRGLAFDGQFYFIGQSRHRYFDRMKEFSNNIALDAGLFLFDDDSKACKFFPMQNLLDIHTLEIFEE